MKRIFIIQNTPLNAPLPLSIYLTDLLRNFSKSKEFEINLIVGKSKSIPVEIKNLCKKVYQFNGSTYSIKDNFNFSFYVNRILKKDNEKKPVDIVHCFYPNSSLLGAMLFKRERKDVKIIYDVRSPWIDMSIERGFINPKTAPFYRWALYREERFLCKKVDSFVFITEGLKDYYVNMCQIHSKKIFFFFTGIDTKKFSKVKSDIRRRYGIEKECILIGSVGGIAKIRKLETFLDLFKDVVSKNKKVKLMFVGKGDLLEELKRKTKKLKLENNIIFLGEVKHEEIPKFMSAFDFGLCHLPNIFIYENSVPLKILEYLSCGVPVLASELKAHYEMAKKLRGIYIYHNVEDILKFLKLNGRVNANLKDFDWRSITKYYSRVWGEI